MTTAGMAVMKWAASSPAPTLSSSAAVAAVSQTTGLVMVIMTVVTSAMRTRPAEVDLHVRNSAEALTELSSVKALSYLNS